MSYQPLPETTADPGKMTARREWTNHEVAYLARWYGDKPATEIAREMGADRSSIRYIVNREMGAEIRAGLAEAGRKRMTEAGRRANEVRHA